MSTLAFVRTTLRLGLGPVHVLDLNLDRVMQLPHASNDTTAAVTDS